MTINHVVVPADETIANFELIDMLSDTIGEFDEIEQLNQVKRLYDYAVRTRNFEISDFIRTIVREIRENLEELSEDALNNPIGSIRETNLMIRNVLKILTAGAIHAQRYDVVDWLYENGVRFGEEELLTAIHTGDDQMVRLLINTYGTPCTDNTLNFAAKHGQLELVKLMHRNGCNLTTETMTNAACSGNIELLNWLRQHSVGYTSDAIREATECNQDQVLEWLAANIELYRW